MHKYNISKISNYDFFLSRSTCLYRFHYVVAVEVKHYLIFSDETGKKLSPLTCGTEIKLKRRGDSHGNMLKVSMLLLEKWQNCLFSDSATSSIFFFPGLFAYSWSACFENLSLSLLYSSPCLPAQDGFGGKKKLNTASHVTLSSGRSQTVKLTTNGVRPGKLTGHDTPLAEGVTFCHWLRSHTSTLRKAHTHIKSTMHPLAVK